MKLEKSETNNAIVVELKNVRKHPNADRLQLATVLGTQVIVDLDSKENIMIYFDSNLRLSYEYLHFNNLFSNAEMNVDTTKKGYFGKNGRVKAQKLRGEVSNGLVMPLESLTVCGLTKNNPELMGSLKINSLNIGDEFTSIDGVKICEKYIVNNTTYGNGKRQQKKIPVDYFWKHWDTKQLMREFHQIPLCETIYIEEKIHGTSGRTGKLLCNTGKKWWQFWKPEQEWKVVSGTRRVDDTDGHIPGVRREIEGKVADQLHKGEQLYYEIYGYDGAKEIQAGFTYGCHPGEYKVMLYRVTITTPDGYCFDLDRETVYKRAAELGLEQPYLLCSRNSCDVITLNELGDYTGVHADIINLVNGKSRIDANTLREGIVLWFRDVATGKWTNLKHKSEEFLMLESKQRDEEIGDVEDNL